MKLVQSCCTDYFMSIQCDNYFQHPFAQEDLDEMIAELKDPDSCVKSIDLSFAAQDAFSERCFVMETDFYNSNPHQIGGGPGPHIELDWTEGTTAQWISENGCVKQWKLQEMMDQILKEKGNLDTFNLDAGKIALIGNSGKYTIRECKLGGKYKFRNDTQQLWILNPPSEKSYFGKEISEEEWKLILAGSWADGAVPVGQQRYVQEMWGPVSEKNEKGEWEW